VVNEGKAARTKRILALMAVALPTVALFASFSPAVASPKPSPGSRLLTYLWNYDHWQLRPYVSAVSLSGGHVVGASGRSRLTGANANVQETLRDQPSSTGAARRICQIAAGGVQKLHLSMVSTVQVWSVDGHPVAHC
jgi:hypothetical protein